LSAPVARAYREDDHAACVALFQSNVPEYFAAVEIDDFLQTLQQVDRYWVIELAGEGIVACGGYDGVDDEPGVAALCWGMVRRDLHRRGLGDFLVRERLRRIDADEDFNAVVIETTRFSCDFYARYGFVVTREQADGFAPGYDLVEMRRPVPWPRSPGARGV
jgi:ribosomal protein S18 acetylase RimI-like enzyme